MVRELLFYLFIVLWSIFLLFFELIFDTNIKLISIFFGMIISGLTAYESLGFPNRGNIYRAITGVVEIILGFTTLFLNVNLVHSGVLLMIGGELIGISLAIGFKKKSSLSLSTSTKRPEPLDPDPSPDPSPF